MRILPADEREQHDALYKLSCGKLVLKLEFKRKHFIAHARGSTLLLDLRREHRTMSVYFNSFHEFKFGRGPDPEQEMYVNSE
jgi:hypothetical protein